MGSNKYGIKISDPSYDVLKAADYQLLFNSEWPSLAVAFEQTVSTPYVSSPQFSIVHNLGFYPFTQCWLYVNGQMIYSFYRFGGGQSFTSTSFSVSQNAVYPKWTTADGTFSNAYPYGFDQFGNYMDGSITAQVHVKCYNLDLTKFANYAAPVPATTKVPYSPDFGIKVVQEGKNINSNDLRDFILHSRAQSPAVLAVLTQDQGVPDPSLDGNTLISYSNPGGYVGWFFGWQKVNFGTPTNPDIRYAALPVQPSNSNQSGADISQAGSYQLSVPSQPGGTMVVLRDPLFASNNQFITY